MEIDPLSKFHPILMANAKSWSTLSSAKRKKVGCVIAMDNRSVSSGYNGTLSGTDNKCEDHNGLTKESVIHAECNAIYFAARKGIKIEGATMYCEYSPCQNCATAVIQSGISAFVFSKYYKDLSGLDLMKASGLQVIKLNEGNI